MTFLIADTKLSRAVKELNIFYILFIVLPNIASVYLLLTCGSNPGFTKDH